MNLNASMQKNRMFLLANFCTVIASATVIPVIAGPETVTLQKGPIAAEHSSEKSSQKDPIAGNWVSEWGPVKFSHDKTDVYSGQWIEGKDKVGKIDSGKFDATKNTIKFAFVETWSGLKGNATLHLSANQKILTGDWVRGKDKGTWKMERQIAN